MASEFNDKFFSERFLKRGYVCRNNMLTQLPFSSPDDFKEHIKQFLCSFVDTNQFVDLYLNNFEKIRTVYSLMGDHHSRGVFIREITAWLAYFSIGSAMGNQLAGHISEQVNNNMIKHYAESLNLSQLCPPDLDAKVKDGLTRFLAQMFGFEQYLYQAPFLDSQVEVGPQKGDICIDLGSCYGETALWMLKAREAGFVYGFDITPENCSIFDKVMSFNHLGDKSQSVLCAVSDYTGTAELKLSNGDSENSIALDRTVIGSGTTTVPTVTLDNFCNENNIKPNFIKADIEGAEMAALKGGAEIISKYKPKFAFSAYHRYDDIYELPYYLHQLNPGYRFYLKRSHPYWELVLFAIDESQI